MLRPSQELQISADEINKQSVIAFNKWKTLWENNLTENKKRMQTSISDILGCYKNKISICFAYGPSLEKNIEQLKKTSLYKNENVVIGCVEKAFKTLIKNGIISDYVLVADGSVSPDYFCDIPIEFIKNTILISNIYARPEFSEIWEKYAGKSKIFFFLNKDNINSHRHFAPMANIYEVLPAASNVGNSLVVWTSQIFWCPQIFLMGYDYSWRDQYYGGEDHKKKHWLGVLREPDEFSSDILFSTPNMKFSARWLDNFIVFAKQQYGFNILNMTGSGILKMGKPKVL